jgi:hypothetical protein
MNRGTAQRGSTPWLIAILGWALTILLIILNYIIPYLKTKRHLPEIRIYVTQSRYGERDEIYYGIIVQNLGRGRDQNINVRFVLNSPSSIKSIRIHNTSRVKLIERGENSAEFVLEELYPDEWQLIDLKVAGKGDFSVSGWSEKSKKISNIFKVGMEIGPEESYKDWNNKGNNPERQ